MSQFLVSEYFGIRASHGHCVPFFLSRDQQLCGFNRITGLGSPQSKECIYFDMPGYEDQISEAMEQRYLVLSDASVDGEKNTGRKIYQCKERESTPDILVLCTLGLHLIRLFADQ